MDIKIKRKWEKRSLYFKDMLKGVMLSSFPDSINNFFHHWELKILKEFFPKNEKNINVLDIGCGYGRLSYSLSKEFKNATFYGVDISKEFVGFFNKKLRGRGRAFVASANKMPFRTKKFDLILMAAVLTYMTSEEITSLIEEIKNVAKKDALIIVIENNISGINYLTGFGLLGAIKKIIGKENKFTIESRYFRDKEIRNYFKNGFFLYEKRKCRLLTLLLPLLYIISRFKLSIFKNIKLDIKLPFLPTLSIAYVFKIKAD